MCIKITILRLNNIILVHEWLHHGWYVIIVGFILIGYLYIFYILFFFRIISIFWKTQVNQKMKWQLHSSQRSSSCTYVHYTRSHRTPVTTAFFLYQRNFLFFHKNKTHDQHLLKDTSRRFVTTTIPITES